MWKNNFLIAIRTLLKNKSTTFFNTLGLTVGIAACLLILLFVRHELSYEAWNPKADRIVRVYPDINFGNIARQFAVAGSVVGPDAAKDLPEVETFCRFRSYGSSLVNKSEGSQQNIRENNILYVDSTFFQLYPRQLLAGQANTALNAPQKMAISESTARKYFGEPSAALGQRLRFDNSTDYTITGVFEDIPVTTHFSADFLISLVGNQEIADSPTLWAMNNNFHTYLLLGPEVGKTSFQAKFKNYAETKLEMTAQQLLGMSLAEFNATGQHAHFKLQNLTDIHLYSNLDVELQPNGNIQYVWIFGAIAFFILLIACINYMNLTTARSAQRSKEIGVRKVLGSERQNLVGQFLSESFILTSVATILGVGIASLAVPWFSQLTNRSIDFSWYQPEVVLTLLFGTLAVTLLAGAYPALFLSGLSPMSILRGHQKGSQRSNLRSLLVVFQFIASTTLIIGTLLVYHQLQYIQNKQLGFNKEQVVILESAYGLGNNIEAYKTAMLSVPGVEKATVSGYLPTPSNRSDYTFSKVRKIDIDNSVNMQVWTVDHDYLQTIGMELVEGRFFDQQMMTDSNAVVLNESAVKNYGFTEAIGQKVYTAASNINNTPTPQDFIEYTVIGVVKDFHFASLKDKIGALGMLLGSSTSNISFRYEADKSTEVLAALEKNWMKLAPGQAFSYTFMDEAFANIYQREQRIGTIAFLFASLAIFISCLGLLGLASYMAEQRTKEIGIRKVLGANIAGLVWLLSKDFLRLVVIALLVATPLAYYFMHQWLQDFAYRVDIGWPVFALAGGIAILLAFGTVSFQSIRAALANPVESLKND